MCHLAHKLYHELSQNRERIQGTSIGVILSGVTLGYWPHPRIRLVMKMNRTSVTLSLWRKALRNAYGRGLAQRVKKGESFLLPSVWSFPEMHCCTLCILNTAIAVTDSYPACHCPLWTAPSAISSSHSSYKEYVADPYSPLRPSLSQLKDHLCNVTWLLLTSPNACILPAGHFQFSRLSKVLRPPRIISLFLSLSFLYFKIMCICISVCGGVYTHKCRCLERLETPDLLESLNMSAVTQTRSSVRAACILNC
jgi:hypothetical protein